MLLTKKVVSLLKQERNRTRKIEDEECFEGEVMKTPFGGCLKLSFNKSLASAYGINPKNKLIMAAYSGGKILPAYELERKRLFNGIDVSCLTDESVLFFDIETTGTSKNNCIFLIGVSWLSGGKPEVGIYLARDYSEESALLYLFSKFLDKYSFICTFNGKSFDMPRILGRAELNLVSLHRINEERHIDLYPVAERRYKKDLPRQNQQSLEAALFSFERENDVRGKAIPGIYKRFVLSQDFGGIKDVLRHNILDMFGLVALYKHFFHTD